MSEPLLPAAFVKDKPLLEVVVTLDYSVQIDPFLRQEKDRIGWRYEVPAIERFFKLRQCRHDHLRGEMLMGRRIYDDYAVVRLRDLARIVGMESSVCGQKNAASLLTA